MRIGLNALCAVAFGGFVLAGGAACAEESPADAIAEKFSHAADDSGPREAEAKKAEVERARMARRLEARRKAEAEDWAAEQRKARAAALQRLIEQRKAQEARLADAARVARDAEEKRLADKFKRVFEQGRSAWLNAK